MGRSRRRAGGGVSGEGAAVEAEARRRERRGGADIHKSAPRSCTVFVMTPPYETIEGSRPCGIDPVPVQYSNSRARPRGTLQRCFDTSANASPPDTDTDT